MIVLDASVVVEILLQSAVGALLAERLLSSESSLYAPHLLDIEVAQVFRRFVLKGDVQPERARQALGILASLPIDRCSHQSRMPRIWALRDNLTAYDVTYVALAEILDATLLTRDGLIARAAGHSARVEVV